MAARGARGRFDGARGGPPDGARGRFGRGRESVQPPVVTREFASTTISDVRVVVTLGNRSRLVDALLTFGEQAITTTDERNGFIGKSMPYASVQHVTLSRSRVPRGLGGVEVVLPGGAPGGNLLSRGPWLWLTFETMDDRLVMRLNPPQPRPVLDLIAERIPVMVERYEGDVGK